MATDRQLIDALVKAAEKTLNRSLSSSERSRLVEIFNERRGSTFLRAKESIVQFGQINESQLELRAAASDDADRAIKDLKDAADQWTPGT